VRIHRDRSRGRPRETPLAYAGLVLAVLFVAGALGSLSTDRGGWAVARLVVALLYAAYAVWFWLRARRRDRAADAADPPRL
jgi:putative copper export protein